MQQFVCEVSCRHKTVNPEFLRFNQTLTFLLKLLEQQIKYVLNSCNMKMYCCPVSYASSDFKIEEGASQDFREIV